ncbi:MAG: CoA transferase [Burkholderiales bacterium]
MLSGLRVLDCSDRLGWLAGRLLADLGAEVIKLEPPGKAIEASDWQAFNVNKRLLRLDLDTAEGRSAFDRLVSQVDFLLETAAPAMTQGAIFAHDRLRALNARLIQVSITPFGASGPRAAWQASDLELMAAGGALSLAGEPEGKPLRISVPQAWAWAGAQAAVGALVALAHRGASGIGQQVHVSAQAAVVTAVAHAPAFQDLLGVAPTRCGEFLTGRAITGARFRAFWPCADGYLNFALYGGPAGRRSNQQLLAWMRETGADAGGFGEVEWKTFDPKVLTQAQIDALEAPIAKFFTGITKQQFLEGASAREILGYPVSTVADIAADPQLQARDFWQDTAAQGKRQRHCGSFAMVDGKRAALRHAPGEPVSLAALYEEFGCIDRSRETAAATS